MPPWNRQDHLSLWRPLQEGPPKSSSIGFFPGLDCPDQKLRPVRILLGQDEQVIDVRLPVSRADQPRSGAALLDLRDRR